MDVRSVLVVVAFAVVDVKLTFCCGFLGVEGDEEGVWVITHQAAAAAGAVFAGDNVPGSDEEGDFVQRRREGDGAAGAFVGGVCEVVVVELVGGEVDGYGVCAFGDDWFYEKARAAKVELVFDCKGGFVRRVDVVMGLKDRSAGYGGFVKSCVPCWEELVAQTQRLRDDLCVGFAGEVGFATTGVDMGMAAEEGVECTGLVPTSQEFLRWVAEEAADICTSEGETRDVVGEEHGD